MKGKIMNKKMLSVLIAGFLLAGVGFNTQSIAAPHNHHNYKARQERPDFRGGQEHKNIKQDRPDFRLKQAPGSFKKHDRQDLKKWDKQPNFDKKKPKQKFKNNEHRYKNNGYHKGIKNGQKSFNKRKKFNHPQKRHPQPQRRR